MFRERKPTRKKIAGSIQRQDIPIRKNFLKNCQSLVEASGMPQSIAAAACETGCKK